jgi:hypothetical protein
MAVVFSGIGFWQQDYGLARSAALLTVLGIFSILMANSLQAIFDEWARNRPKAVTLIVLTLFFAAVEVYLVHFGLAWAFIGWDETAAYLGSFGFTAVNVFAKWAFTPTAAREAESSLGDNVVTIRSKLA